ncbi:MAG TPA: GerMN domain-containing protein, partial [Pseudonocardiaceae bacterium]
MTHPWTHRSRRPFVAALVGGVLLLTGCANIPTQTEPQPLNIGGGQSTEAAVSQPPPDASPADIVQDWVRNGGDPVGKHAAARAYLANSAKNSWNDTARLTIVADTPVIAEPVPVQPGDPANQRVVTLTATVVGELGPDNAFQPRYNQLVLPITVQKQKSGEWRIVQPPDGVVITQSAFTHFYRGVNIYFFDPPMGALVPDLRYIADEAGANLAARVIDELLSGPSNAMANALRSAIPSSVTTKTVPAEQADGAIQVNLTKLPDEPAHTKQLIIEQIVNSLHEISPSPVLVQSEGTALIPDQPEWGVNELPSYNATTTPNAGQAGLLVAHGKVLSLKDGTAVSGGAGDGSYDVQTGAQ